MGVLAITRKQIPHVWQANGATTIQQLNKSLAYREMAVTLKGQPTLTAANNLVANTLKGDEWGVVKRIRIIANSSDVLFDMSGTQLWWFNRFHYNNKPAITTTLGDDTTANPLFGQQVGVTNTGSGSTLIIPFWALKSVKPMDSVFDSGGLTDFRMEVTWGTFTDVNSAATAWTNAPTLSVHSHENELTPAFYPPLVKRTVAQQQIVNGASTAFRFNLDVGPLYRGFLFNVTTNANPAVDTPGLITNVKLVSGSTIFFDCEESFLNQYGSFRTGVPFNVEFSSLATAGVTTAEAFYRSPKINTSENETGWYALDLVTDGYLSECINTARFNEFYLEFSTSAGCIINVISNQFLSNPRAPRSGG